jgi:hypothetical protein
MNKNMVRSSRPAKYPTFLVQDRNQFLAGHRRTIHMIHTDVNVGPSRELVDLEECSLAAKVTCSALFAYNKSESGGLIMPTSFQPITQR